MSQGPRLVRLVRPLGGVSHHEGLALQERLKGECAVNGMNSLVLLEHTPHYTAGRRERPPPEIRPDARGCRGPPVFEVERGGQVTFHGPGQLTLYPILDLQRFCTLAGGDSRLKWYSRGLSSVLQMAASPYGIHHSHGAGGVGLYDSRDRKIGFVGFRVSRWITSYGLSLNVNVDLSHFDRIVPCGDSNARVANLADGLCDREEVASRLMDSFCNVFDCNLKIE